MFHKYIQPFILKFWNPWAKKTIDASSTGTDSGDGPAVDSAMRDSEEYKYIMKMIKENPVMVFSKTTCTFCKMAKEVLDNIGVVYRLEEIDRRSDCAKLQDVFAKITDARTVPRVFIGGKCIGGGSETYTLHNQGGLLPLLRDAGATFKKTD
jgi:glutaredoxin 3